MSDSTDARKAALDAAASAKPKGKDKALPPTPPPRSTGNAGGIGNVAAALDPKAHRQAIGRQKIADDLSYDTAVHFGFLGSGQGGGRIAQAFWELGYRRVGIFNTTDTDFEGLAEELPKLSMDINGAAKDMRLARQAMAGRDEEVRDLLARSWGAELDCGVICVGLGGGTGSGTALPLVKAARAYMESVGRPPRVGAIVSLPDAEEGQQVARNAVTAFQELLDAGVSPLIVIDNDRVHELYQPPMSKLLPKSNEIVAALLHLFNRLAATRSPYVTFDGSELLQLLDSGIVVMGAASLVVGEIHTPVDVSTKIRDELAHSILATVDLRTGRKAACVFVAAQQVLDTFGKDFFAAGFTQLDRIVGANLPEGTQTVVHRGIYLGDSDGLQCYTMIAGLEPPRTKLAVLSRVGGLKSFTSSSVAKHLGVDN